MSGCYRATERLEDRSGPDLGAAPDASHPSADAGIEDCVQFQVTHGGSHSWIPSYDSLGALFVRGADQDWLEFEGGDRYRAVHEPCLPVSAGPFDFIDGTHSALSLLEVPPIPASLTMHYVRDVSFFFRPREERLNDQPEVELVHAEPRSRFLVRVSREDELVVTESGLIPCYRLRGYCRLAFREIATDGRLLGSGYRKATSALREPEVLESGPEPIVHPELQLDLREARPLGLELIQVEPVACQADLGDASFAGGPDYFQCPASGVGEWTEDSDLVTATVAYPDDAATTHIMVLLRSPDGLTEARLVVQVSELAEAPLRFPRINRLDGRGTTIDTFEAEIEVDEEGLVPFVAMVWGRTDGIVAHSTSYSASGSRSLSIPRGRRLSAIERDDPAAEIWIGVMSRFGAPAWGTTIVSTVVRRRISE